MIDITWPFPQPPHFRDRRIAASDEHISVQRGRLYREGSHANRIGGAMAPRRGGAARTPSPRGATTPIRFVTADRQRNEIQAIILHQTSGREFIGQIPDRSTDSRWQNDHDIDKIGAHFVVLNDGTVFYTHDLQYLVQSAGGRKGIDIEFAGEYSSSETPIGTRLSEAAIISGRRLIYGLATILSFSITNIHPHGQVQYVYTRERPGGRSERIQCYGSDCPKYHTCPGPDIWVNIGMWATGPPLHLNCESTPNGSRSRTEILGYYQNNGISDLQTNPRYDQHITYSPYGGTRVPTYY